VGRRVVLLAGMLGAGCTETANKLSGLLGMEVVNSERVFREIVTQERISFAELSMRARSARSTSRTWSRAWLRTTSARARL